VEVVAKYNKMNLLILHILAQDNPSVEGMDGDNYFQANETVVEQLQAQ
jgi:hypothetical protein